MSLWDHYVFRRGSHAQELWDNIFSEKPVRLLYIAGAGFDVRAQRAMKKLVDNISQPGREIDCAELLLIELTGYDLDDDLLSITESNSKNLQEIFSRVGETERISLKDFGDKDDEISESNRLSLGVSAVIDRITDHTDIVLDVSSLPRVVYFSLVTRILNELVPDRSIGDSNPAPLSGKGVNFQVVVAEDARLDGAIRPEDPSGDLIIVPGFAGALHVDSTQDWPMVWLPMLGENRANQLKKLTELIDIPAPVEICPVLPHPSSSPRRADSLLLEYRSEIFDKHDTPISNILYVHEANPFEVYRQLLLAMRRYTESMKVLGGCRILVTPLGSKLVTLGAALACFEMHTTSSDAGYKLSVPHVEPKRYSAQKEQLEESNPDISVLLLTGTAYEES